MSAFQPESDSPTLFFLHYEQVSALQSGFMPFLKNGGLFIPCKGEYQLGQQVFLLIRFQDEATQLAVCATVAWVSPDDCEYVEGIGVRLNDRDGRARDQLEKILAEEETGAQHSYTLEW